MTTNPRSSEVRPVRAMKLPRRPGGVVVSCLAGVAALGLMAGVAIAQEPADPVLADGSDVESPSEGGGDAEAPSTFDSFAVEDQAVILRFEDCLEAEGIDDVDPGHEGPYNAADAAAATCEPMLEELSFDPSIWMNEGADPAELSEFDTFSIEDRGVIWQFEKCLSESGLAALEAAGDADAVDAVFAGCTPVLDGLSFDPDRWLNPVDAG